MTFPVIAEDEAAQLQLEWGEWKPIPRVSIYVPFGYKVSEEDPNTLEPIVLELEALEKAKKYRDIGHSLRDVASWVEEVTGRKITHSGLDKRIKSDSQRRSKAKTIRLWAKRYKEAIKKAYEWDQKHIGDCEEFYRNLLSDDPRYDPVECGKGVYNRG